MTTVALQSGPPTARSWLRKKFGDVTHGIAVAAAIAITPARPVLKNLLSIPFTVAGIASIDFAAFHLSHGVGWLVTGVSMVLLEHMIADE